MLRGPNSLSDTSQVPSNDDLAVAPEAQAVSNSQETNSVRPTLRRREEEPQENRPQREPWTSEDIEELIWCYEYVKANGTTNYKAFYKVWRERNPNRKTYINDVKLSNQRRYIMQNKKIAENKIAEIKEQVRKEIERESRANDESRVEAEQLLLEDQQNKVHEDAEIDELEVIRQEIEKKIYSTQLTSFNDRQYITKAHGKNLMEFIEKVDQQMRIIMQNMENRTLRDINNVVYAGALVVSEKFNGKIQKKSSGRTTTRNEDKAAKRIQDKIAKCRQELSLMEEIRKGNVRRKEYKAKQLLRSLKIKEEKELVQEIERRKQQISAWVQRSRRFKKRIEQFKQNKRYAADRKGFFRNISGKTVEVKEIPKKEEIESFWGNLYETKSEYNKKASWLPAVKNITTETMTWSQITEEDVSNALKETLNWKSPGLDKIQNFWLKYFKSTHRFLAEEFSKLMEMTEGRSVESFPEWLTTGITTLLAKGDNTKDPKNYRPITCLCTMYKTLTKIIANKVSKFLKDNCVIPPEQKGCAKDTLGCKDQLLLSKAILEDCAERKGNLAQAWIDYKKAFDSVPHDWILATMEMCGVAKEIVNFCRRAMMHWKTRIVLRSENKVVQSRCINIKRGIFQGDSLSPLLFCISMVPLSHLIKAHGKGYKLRNSEVIISHLFYMDDLKLFCKAKTELQTLLRTVERFSDDIKMDLGLEKCAVLTIRNGRRTQIPGVSLDSIEIKSLEAGTMYKYLGVDEAEATDHRGTKEKLIKEYKRRVRSVLSTQLNARNKMSAVGTLAVPVLQYSFGIVKWTIEEIKQLDRDTRKMLTMYKCHHPEASVDRLYVPRKKGGRGLLRLERMYKAAIINLMTYVHEENTDHLVAEISRHDNTLPANASLKKKANKYLTQLGIKEKFEQVEGRKKKKRILKAAMDELDEEAWKNKEMYGQYIREFAMQPLDKTASLKWLSSAGLKPETESLIIAAQDQALNTRYRQGRIINPGADTKCRLCGIADETIEHITSSCSVLAKTEYVRRHDRVAKLVHYQICKAYDYTGPVKNWYDHEPNPVTIMSDGKITVLWNQPIRTDRQIRANKPDIVIRSEKECTILDVAVPSDRNVLGKEAEKLLKYKDLAIELQRSWNRKVKIVPIIVSATGNVSKNFTKFVGELPGNHNPWEIQKQAVLGTMHILRKAL